MLSKAQSKVAQNKSKKSPAAKKRLRGVEEKIAKALDTYAEGNLSRATKGQGRKNATFHLQMDFSLIFPQTSNKPEGKMTPLEKMNLADRGVTKKDLEALKEKTTLDYDELAKALSVGRATLINKKGNDKFSPQLSEKIVGLAELYSYGYEVFEDKDRFNQWMLRSNQALGGKAPYDLIHNQFGREEVRNIIGRIDYGVFS